MDTVQGAHRGTGCIPLPLVSKSPLPLVSNDKLGATSLATMAATRREAPKGSCLPRPARTAGGSIIPHTLFGNHVAGDLSSPASRERHDWHSHSRSIKPARTASTARTVRAVRSQFQIRENLQAVSHNPARGMASALESTSARPGVNGAFFEDGNENATHHISTQKKARHRMSLSERTVETLSTISPSPTPTRQRRQSLLSSDGGRMGPPPRPASQARTSRVATPAGSKSRSAVIQPFRPPGGLSECPPKSHHVPALSSANLTLSLPKAPARVTGSMRLAQRSVSNTAVVNGEQNVKGPARSLAAQTMRLKSTRHTPSHTRSISQAYTSIFSPPASPSESRLAVNGAKPGASSGQPLTKRPTVAASSVCIRAKKAETVSCSKIGHLRCQESSSYQRKDGAKSSAALRSVIAQAKAARKDAASKVSPSTTRSTISAFGRSSASDQADVVVSNQGLLKSRIRSALTSGQLNIAAMKLQSIPAEVMRMYEPNETSVSWAEVVDLVKFNAADNQITHLGHDLFPDWCLEEVANSDDKSNPFGGIESLYLHNNQLHSLPLGLRQLERLTVINLSGNQLSNDCLDIVWQLATIRDLNLSRNQLTGRVEIPMHSLFKLQAVNLSGNTIHSLIMDDEQAAYSSSPLRALDVSNNQLADLPWETLASFELLAQLNASANHLTTVILNPLLLENAFKNLRELDLSNNSIEAIEPDLRLPSVQTFTVNNNRLHSLPDMSSWGSLITLQAAENKLSEIPKAVRSTAKPMSALKSVDLSLNNIKTLHPAIAKLHSLTSLQLTGNPLGEPRFLSMDTESIKKALLNRLGPEGADDHESSGQSANHAVPSSSSSSSSSNNSSSSNSSRNEASGGSLYQHTAVNGMLDLSSKGLTEKVDLSTINLESAIHTLRLSNNDMAAFPQELLLHLSVNSTLKSLDLSHNPLTCNDSTTPTPHTTTTSDTETNAYLTADLHLPALESLYIVSTGFGSLDPLLTHLKAPQLRELNMSCHRLTGPLPQVRTWFPNCTTLLATDNWFSSIQVDAVRGVEVLDIRNNEIGSLPPTIGLLGNKNGKREPGRLRSFECGGNRFRVPRIGVIEKGTEAVLKDLRRMIPEADIPDDWRDEI